MPEQNTTESSYEDHQIAGSAVRIERTGDTEQLLIEGRPSRFWKTDAGYVLHANAYVEPQETLLAAAKLHLERPDS